MRIFPKLPRRTEMSETITYSVPGVSCGHCQTAITAEVSGVGGVDSVHVDLDTKLVRVSGENLDDAALIAAIDEAGYDATRV
jgi:copper chaperone